MEIRKACYLCNQKLASNTCRKCSRPVCNDDFHKSSGMCSMCILPRHIKRN